MSEKPAPDAQCKKFLPYVKDLLREEVNENLSAHAYRLDPITTLADPRIAYIS
jgi:hypothetical protein